MKIVVIVKEVADTEAVITLTDGQPDLSATAMVANPYDEFAVEEALQQAQKLGDCTVTAVMVGREKSKENLAQDAGDGRRRRRAGGRRRADRRRSTAGRGGAQGRDRAAGAGVRHRRQAGRGLRLGA